MNLKESISAILAQSNRYKAINAFTKAFRGDDLGNIMAGEEFVIPEDYQVISQIILRNGVPAKDAQGNTLTAEFIRVQTNTGRFVNFFPSSLTKIVFKVDENTGKDLVGADRIARSKGDLVDYVKKNLDMNVTMNNLKGCTVKCVSLTSVPARRFGVPNDMATKDDVQANNVGEWTLVGDKKPANWGV